MSDRPKDFQTPQEAKRYQAMKHRLFLFNLILNFSFLVALVVTGFSKSLKNWLLPFGHGFFSMNALYFLSFSVLAFCLSFPMDFYEGFVLEHRFGLSRQNFKEWLKDVFKKSAIVFIVSLILVEAVYFFLARFPGIWWLGAAGFWFLVTVILTRITPKVLLPLFFKYKPLEAGALRERIENLLRQHQVALKEIYVLDFSKKTVKANAMVAGLGKSKQIFLSDTLVSEFPEPEIEVVLAHEVGHYLSGDTVKLVFAGLVSALLSFWAASLILNQLIGRFGFQSLSDIAGIPLLLAILMLVSLILLPLQNGFSRVLEQNADRFALRATGNPAGFIAMMKRLGEKNFSEFAPSKLIEIFLYDHPPISKRIRMAESYV
jgi:STE24 endopeptidase